MFIAAIKGLVAGITNCTLALALGAALPSLPLIGAAMTVGLLGYGLSLVLYILALRGLGSARASAYFSTAPFLGAAVGHPGVARAGRDRVLAVGTADGGRSVAAPERASRTRPQPRSPDT